jgi:hypothetical protein
MGWLLSLIGGGLIERLSAPFLQAYRDRLSAQNDANKIGGEIAIKQIDAEIAARGDARAIRIATAGHWEQRLLSFLIAAPFVIHAGAVGLDTTFRLGWGIPKYPQPFDEWEAAILLSFFGLQAASKIATTVAAAIIGRRQ